MYNVQISAYSGQQNLFFVRCEFLNVRCWSAASANQNYDNITRGSTLARFRFGMGYRVGVYIYLLFFSSLFIGQLVYIYMYPISHTVQVERNLVTFPLFFSRVCKSQEFNNECC